MPDQGNRYLQAILTALAKPEPPQAPPAPSMPFQSQPYAPIPIPDAPSVSRIGDILDMLGKAYAQYPTLRKVNPLVVDRTAGGMKDDRHLEWYPPNEDQSPHPGQYVSEWYDPKVDSNGVAADMLHGLPQVDPRYAALRDQFKQTFTPQQVAMDQRSFAQEHEPGDTFQKWMDRGRVDAYIRGWLFNQGDWRQNAGYTPQQQQILEQMRAYIQGKK